MKKLLCYSLLSWLVGISLLMPLEAWAQDQTQTLRGTVVDQETQQPLPGVTVRIMVGEETVTGTYSDESGKYRIERAPLGRIVLIATLQGSYSEYKRDNILVTSAREAVHDIELVPAALSEVVILPPANAPRNPVSVASTRTISVDLAKRAAGAVDDPSRLVMGFPGVQAPQDNNSDLVIRGNSPVGLLWRLEGIDIPNPNHFARKGSSGGGITVFSAQLLDESDFSTGAWAAEYGNAFSGVFDMRFRKGNNEQRQYRFRTSLLGIDAATEGPFKQGRGSYLVNYRYSTLGILNDLGFRLVGERIDNNFQDLSFNLNFQLPNDRTFISWFGIGGLSEEIWDPKWDSLTWTRDYRSTTDFLTDMGATGVTLTHSIDKQSYFKAIVAVMGNRVRDNDDSLDVRGLRGAALPLDLSQAAQDSLLATRGAWDREDYRNWRISSHVFYNRKVGDLGSFRAGVMGSHINFSFEQRRRSGNANAPLTPLLSGAGRSQLLQGYARFTLRRGRWTINPGVHAMSLTLNGTYGIDPRLSIKYQVNERQSVFLAYGQHSSILPLGNYFTEVDGGLVNQDLDLLQAQHLVGGYDVVFPSGYHLRLEGYYQRLANVPVVPSPDSTYWLLNERSGYATQDLVSDGRGLNYGLDMVFEKFFQRGTFFLLSGSVFQSLYATQYPDTFFNTKFNSNYNLSAMGGKEWYFDQGGIFQLSSRVMLNGGLRYTPGDLTRSAKAGYFVGIDRLAYSERVGTYFRIDGKVSYRRNAEQVAWQLYFEAQNLTGRRNVRDLVWSPGLKDFIRRYQSGLIPNIGFQIDF